MGFSAAGPVAGKRRSPLLRRCTTPSNLLRCRTLGTLAAGIQAGIGNVAAGSLFAAAQGAAMGAGIPVLANVVGGAVSGTVGVVIAALV